MSKAAGRVEHLSLLWAGPEHAAELARLRAPLFEEAWNEASFRELLGHPGATVLLARTGTPPQLQTVGFVLGQIAADEAEILALGVCKDWQRRGIGLKLVEGLIRAARKAEARALFLEVAAGNAAALGLYARLGFAEAGRRKGYYLRAGRPAEDAIRLSLSL
jgi:[ribosomal protein S18]-alanine N-acetyltransferase